MTLVHNQEVTASTNEPQLDLRSGTSGLSLRVRVKPRSPRDRVAGVKDGALVVQLKAPPVEGAANAALLHLIGQLLGRSPSSLSLLYGASHREKVVLIPGADLATVRDRLLSAAVANRK